MTQLDVAPSDTAKSRRFPVPARWIPTPKRVSALYLLALVVIVFGGLRPDLFFSYATFQSVLNNQVIVAMLALAVMIPFCAGAFDLSVGSMLAFSIVVLSKLTAGSGLPVALCALVAVAACGLVGALSALLTVYFKVNSFIATLAVSQILSAGTLLISDNKQIVGVFSQSFLDLGTGTWLGLPKAVFYLVAVALIVWYILDLTPFGRQVFATGANPEAARLAGVPTGRIVATTLVGSGVVAGLAGVMYSMQVGTFSNSVGPSYLFPAFAALFFGATQFRNRPNVPGTILAVYVLAFGVQGLQLLLSTNTYWITPLFNGVALAAAVAVASRAGVLRVRRPRRTGPPPAAHMDTPDRSPKPSTANAASASTTTV